MGLWGTLKGVAGRLLPFFVQSGLEEYRRKNPKSGWIVDATQSAFLSAEQDLSFRSLVPEKKVARIAKQITTEFPGTDTETAKAIARLVVTNNLTSDKKGA